MLMAALTLGSGCRSMQSDKTGEGQAVSTNVVRDVLYSVLQTFGRASVEMATTDLKTRLNLTPEQEGAVRNIYTAEMARMTNQFFKGVSEESKEPQRNNHHPDVNEQIRLLLTPEQLAIYDPWQKEMEAAGKKVMIERAREGAIERSRALQTALKLNAEQSEKVTAIVTENALARVECWEGRHESCDLVSLHAREAEQMRVVLTPRQFKWYEQRRNGELSRPPVWSLIPIWVSGPPIHR